MSAPTLRTLAKSLGLSRTTISDALRGSPRVLDVVRGRDRGKVHGGFAERVEPGASSLLKVIP